MKNIKNEIWILADDRPGTFSQSVGLAEEIGLEYKIIKLDYSFFSILPNCFLSTSSLRISRKTKKTISELNYLPKIIISAGRRCAPIALYLQKKSEGQIKIIQIMNPNLNFKKFDFVILPKHDKIKSDNLPNLITTIGSLTKINDKIIESERQKFSAEFANISKTKIALLLGGSSKKTKFKKDSAIKLAKIASKVGKKMDAVLLILNSRRTDEEISVALKENLNCDFKFFDWKENTQRNPYLAIISYADFFIATGDSVSMISECGAMGKPLYIFDEENISSNKHRKFHQNLFAENYAKKLEDQTEVLEKFSQKKLEETKRVASLIKNTFFKYYLD